MEELEFDKNKSIGPFLKRMFGYVWKFEKKYLILMLTFAGVVGMVDSSFPKLFSMFIHDCLGNQANLNGISLLQLIGTPCLQKYLWILLGVILILVCSVMIFVYSAGAIAERIIFHMRRQLFEKYQALPFSYFDKNSSGWLLSRISSDTDRISEVISWGLIGMAWATVSIVFCFGIMFYTNIPMAIIVFLSIPLMVLTSSKIREKILFYSRKSRKINSEMIGLINEHIHGVELNKSLANEDKALNIFTLKAIDYRKAAYKSAFFNAAYFPVIIVVGNMAAASVLGYGAHQILEQVPLMTIGILSSFFIYALQIFEPISDMSNYYSIAQNSMSAGERIFTTLDEPLEIKDEKHLSDFKEIKGEIELRNILFGYNEEKIILNNFNLKIPPGQQLALVGPTGEGKSTIASIIARFYQPQGGDILIDGISVSDRTMKSFREQVGVVLQQPHVFSGTIYSNICYGKKELPRVEIEKILKEMGCEDMIARLEEEIQPDGINLSLGEKQIISIARVFAYNPKILILDEATSAIDAITEQRLQLAVKKVLKGRTSIVIAHRLSTIVESDRILYIQNRAIAEDGSHSELMEKKGAYWGLHQVV
jgi:ATP-binding cassette, subfamily B, bacterial